MKGKPTQSAVELLAPAGEPDAGYAAIHYGADAIYLGLPRFSARAEATNFSFDDLGAITAYAHARAPRRRVYVTLNTVVMDGELPDAVELLARAAACGVDAVIVQDFGVARIVRAHFPELRLHASTQMAIHSLAGAQAAAELGFDRVTLARELTAAEVGGIASGAGIETEAFIHGALCYSYSGLCLFSSLTRGQSGNRGRCKYPCRDRCRTEEPARDGFPFSMKDMALRAGAAVLRDAGVSSLKIEGRMKSPLYVATVVDYYRRLLDGRLTEAAALEAEADMRTVFARPWTRLYLDGPRGDRVIDAETVGHRGAEIGRVERVTGRLDFAAVRFRTSRRLEVHDGIQIDIPGQDRPFGFPVDELRLAEERGDRAGRRVFVAPAGSMVEVGLPAEYPRIPSHAAVYCSSSQDVKNRYGFDRPKPGLFRARIGVGVTVRVEPGTLRAEAVIPDTPASPGGGRSEAAVEGTFGPAADVGKTESAARAAFAKTGDSACAVESVACVNPDGLFAPMSLLNELRRRLIADTERVAGTAIRERIARIAEAVHAHAGRAASAEPAAAGASGERWILKVDRAAFLDALEPEDWAAASEVIVDVAREPGERLEAALRRAADARGAEAVRLALPILMRERPEAEMATRIERLVDQGWTRWQVSSLAGLRLLRSRGGLQVTADWPLYVLNGAAADELLGLGVTRFTLSPEDGRENMAMLLGAFGEAAEVLAYQDVPLFQSASCLRVSISGACPGRAACDGGEAAPMRLGSAASVLAISDECRTVVIGERPYVLAGRLGDLRAMGARVFRADFVWRPYEAQEVCELWRRVRAGQAVAGTVGNFDRGLA